jgi:hypothetical protein
MSASPLASLKPAAKPAATHSAIPGTVPFGTPKRVTDAQGNSLTVTPVKAWWLPGHIQSRYVPQSALSPAENGKFLIIEMKVEAVSGTAYFPAPISGAGPAILSRHRLFSDGGTSASDNVVWNTCLPYTDSNVPLHPGNWLLNSETFDVPPGLATLRWLVGTQGASAATWQVPTHSTARSPQTCGRRSRPGTGADCPARLISATDSFRQLGLEESP